MLSLMPVIYHDSVNSVNTKEIHFCDLVQGMNTNSEQSAGQRLKIARKKASMTQQELAAAAGVGQSAIGNIEAGTRGFGSSVLQISKALNVNPRWLATGEGEMIETYGRMDANPTSLEMKEVGATYNVTVIRPKSAPIPIVSWVQAGDMTEIAPIQQHDEWAVAWHITPSKRAFALRVEGESMTNPYPNQLSFPQGTLLIVDPERAALAGDYVIAKDVLTQKATFKQLMHDSGRWFLKAINPAYPMIEIDDPAIRVIARVVEYQLPSGKL